MYLQSNTFITQFAFTCGCCDERFDAGTIAYYDSNHILRNGEPEHVWSGGISEGPGPDSQKNIEVMPRGKTAKDRCNRCFQIPSNNGVCGCE